MLFSSNIQGYQHFDNSHGPKNKKIPQVKRTADKLPKILRKYIGMSMETDENKIIGLCIGGIWKLLKTFWYFS